jgi:uncharacterized tellurite resistance protein B-like protein
MIPPGQLGFEVMKLLLQVAWADGELAEGESDALMAHADTLGLDAASRQLLTGCLAGTAPLPAPNLGLLKQERVAVLKLVREVITSDGQVSEEEEELLAQISQLLV